MIFFSRNCRGLGHSAKKQAHKRLGKTQHPLIQETMGEGEKFFLVLKQLLLVGISFIQT